MMENKSKCERGTPLESKESLDQKDYLLVATAYSSTVRIYAALTTGVVEAARLFHDTWPTATAALGRVLTGTLMMRVMDMDAERLTVEFSGDGYLGRILAVSNERGTVKGYLDYPQVNPALNTAGKLDVSGALGKGRLSVIKDLGLKGPYQGIVPIQTGEIGEDFAYYFTKSEQTPSAVALGVLVNPDGRVKVAGGLIIQLMPGAAEATIQDLESKLSKFPQLTNSLSQGISIRDLIQEFGTGPDDVKILEEIGLKYQCDCSLDHFRGPLLSLDHQELDDIIREHGEVEVRCNFCNKLYHYSQSDLGLE
jgi:molecular chaperone Hsp33